MLKKYICVASRVEKNRAGDVVTPSRVVDTECGSFLFICEKWVSAENFIQISDREEKSLQRSFEKLIIAVNTMNSQIKFFKP